MAPTCPYSMHSDTFGYIDNEVYVGIIVVIGASRNFHVSVRHTNVFRVDLEILRSGHYREFNSAIIAKGFVAPLSDGPNLLHSGNTYTNVNAYANIKDSAYIPLFAMST